MAIETEIVNWYQHNKRDLPWRNTKNAYEIWISEVILQQTRVNQAIDYYYAFLEKFPTVKDLANASEQEVLKIWQGLGYYSRARNLLYSAKYISQFLGGKMPENYKELIKLKGIGEYTAAAISSFAYNEKVAVVDGNVYRVLSRIYAESTPINSTKGKKLFIELATDLLKTQEPYLFNQAIMEFGAIQCTIKNPNCSVCVIKEYCLAFQNKEVEKYPVKNKLLKRKNRYLNYVFVEYQGNTFLKTRELKDIWHGLFEFPLIETIESIEFNDLCKTKEWQELFGNSKFNLEFVSESISHQLTHQQLAIKFIIIKIEVNLNELNYLNKKFQKVLIEDIQKYPVPKPIENFISHL